VKIAWFTAVTGTGAVADYSRWVLAAMPQLCEPCLCCSNPPEGFPAAVPVLDLGADPEALWDVGPLDAVFYVLGNDLQHDAWTFEMARIYSGIVVLLEPTLHPFFLDYYGRHLRRPDLYVTRMAEHYGLEGLMAGHDILGPSFDPAGARVSDEDLRRYTFTEEALRSADGAVVHSSMHGVLARRVWGGLVHETEFPVASATRPPAERNALAYARSLLSFAEQLRLPRVTDYFERRASQAVADRMATQIGQTLGSLGSEPGSPQVEAVIAEARQLLPPPSP
jgi:hypothetical protein